MAILDSLLNLPDNDERRPGSFLLSLAKNQRALESLLPQTSPGGGGAPRGGSLLELIYGGNAFNPSSADPSHPSHLHVAAKRIRPILRWIDQLPGFAVGEHPAYGGVDPVHTENSWHYKGKAGDINYTGGGRFANEAEALNWLEHKLQRRY